MEANRHQQRHDSTVIVVCSACQQHVQPHSHYKTQWHRYNLKRKCASLPPITHEQFQARCAAASALAEKKEPEIHRCDVCNTVFKSQKTYIQHLPSKKHKRNAQRREAEEQKFQLEPTQTEEIIEEKTELSGHLPCPFCDNCFHFDQRISHMQKQHGFHIPYEQQCVDEEGLLEYLFLKVTEGRECAFCHTMFSDVYAVRQHMSDKQHCKMAWNEDDPYFEFDEFYEFNTHEVPIVEINHVGELVLRDGKMLGSREMSVYYKQHFTTDHLKASGQLATRAASGGAMIRRDRSRRNIGPGSGASHRCRKPKEVERRERKDDLRLGMKQNKLRGRYMREQVLF